MSPFLNNEFQNFETSFFQIFVSFILFSNKKNHLKLTGFEDYMKEQKFEK